MTKRRIDKEDKSNCIYRIVRISPELRRFVPTIGTGLRLLISCWEFPETRNFDARATRIRLSEEDLVNIDYIVRHAGKSTTAVVVAALHCARHSHVRPPGTI